MRIELSENGMLWWNLAIYLVDDSNFTPISSTLASLCRFTAVLGTYVEAAKVDKLGSEI